MYKNNPAVDATDKFAGTANTCVCGDETKPTDPCVQIDANKIVSDCLKTADGGSGNTKCCLLTAKTKLKTRISTGGVNVVTNTKGSEIDSGDKFHACYKSGSSFIFKTGGNTADVTNADAGIEGWAFAHDYCKATAQTTAKFYKPALTTDVLVSANDVICSCGVRIALDACSSLATNNVKNDCIKTDDGASGKCCLVTFNGVPTTSTGNKDITPHSTGTYKDGANILACMKRTNGKIVFVTSDSATTWGARRQIAYLKGAEACGSTGVVPASSALTSKTIY